jgi:hypothetical protein
MYSMTIEYRDVNPRELRLPSSRTTVDPHKLARRFRQFGASVDGMPPLTVFEAADVCSSSTMG